MPPIVYSPRYHIDIGAHVFPTRKYHKVHERLISTGVARPADFVEPTAATWDELGLVHTREYLHQLRDGLLSPEDTAQLELPWSRTMVEGFRLMVGGTIDAACLATGINRRHPEKNDMTRPSTPAIVCHIGGGLHHAFPNHGEGFCPLNDVAVAARVLQASGLERVAIIDLDVHHGNGTAFIFDSDLRVFTFSMHQQLNYPMWKPRGSLDIGLANGVHDATFLSELDRALPRVMASRPECVFYLAGADPYEHDQLGGLRLTRQGLRERDRRVLETVHGAGIPAVVTLAGGYAPNLDDVVEIHAATIEEAARLHS